MTEKITLEQFLGVKLIPKTVKGDSRYGLAFKLPNKFEKEYGCIENESFVVKPLQQGDYSREQIVQQIQDFYHAQGLEYDNKQYLH